MIKVGIIGAMDEEVKHLIENVKLKVTTHKAGMEFHSFCLHGKEVVVVRCGIGKVNASSCTQILIDDFHVTHIINTGIAGALRDNVEIGDIVLSTSCVQHDVDVTEFGHDAGVIPRMKSSVFKASETLVDLAFYCNSKENVGVTAHIGRIVSGDQFISDKERKRQIEAQFDGVCVEMEGAAIAQVCCMNDIPFVIIRAISDKADGEALADYAEFEALAVGRSVNLVNRMIAEI